MFIMTESRYSQGVVLEEYNGAYSLVSAKQTDTGTYTQWCRPRVGKEKYSETAVPMGVRLGDKAQAVTVLERFVQMLKRGMAQTKSDREENLDIPF